jgi:hypothetical protein
MLAAHRGCDEVTPEPHRCKDSDSQRNVWQLGKRPRARVIRNKPITIDDAHASIDLIGKQIGEGVKRWRKRLLRRQAMQTKRRGQNAIDENAEVENIRHVIKSIYKPAYVIWRNGVFAKVCVVPKTINVIERSFGACQTIFYTLQQRSDSI